MVTFKSFSKVNWIALFDPLDLFWLRVNEMTTRSGQSDLVCVMSRRRVGRTHTHGEAGGVFGRLFLLFLGAGN